MSKPELIQELTGLGERPFRANQIRDWLYRKNVKSFDEMANLPKALRALLKEHFVLRSVTLQKEYKSQDGTRKFLFQLQDGLTIESVLIPEKEHMTLCVSSQVGCSMGCVFCLTGKGGFRRNLGAGEIVDQILEIKRLVGKRPPITNVVFMGMGEPLLNFEEVKKAIDVLTDPEALGFSHRRVTLSTSGIVPGIKRLGNESKINLAVSLNAPNDEIRSAIMPVNKKYPLTELLKALRDYPLQKGRRITFEYVMIRDVNDRPSHARELSDIIKGIPSKVNLIPLNTFPGLDLSPPSEEQIHSFQDILFRNNITAIVRKSKGSDILAACGQLAGLRTF